MAALEQILELKKRMAESIIGQEHVVERVLLSLLANGNLLLEGLPGLAKTRTIKALAQNLDAKLSRIQFTPDLLPSDVTGSEVLHTGDDGQQVLQFQPGPIFANLVLADEINRAPAKVQAALLEAMEERQVTVAGTTHKLDPLFMVLATQNPIEQEGTYPLPEAQMDRFLMKVMIFHPPKEDEVKIMRLVRGEEPGTGDRGQESGDRSQGEVEGGATVPQDAVFGARQEITSLHVADAVETYIADLVEATRHPEAYGDPLGQWINIGSSPRATIALDKVSRAHAWLKGRDHVTPEDVQAIAPDVLRHRVMLSYEAEADGITPDRVVEELLKQVAVG
jgi:MoxR-like ATPase